MHGICENNARLPHCFDLNFFFVSRTTFVFVTEVEPSSYIYAILYTIRKCTQWQPCLSKRTEQTEWSLSSSKWWWCFPVWKLKWWRRERSLVRPLLSKSCFMFCSSGRENAPIWGREVKVWLAIVVEREKRLSRERLCNSLSLCLSPSLSFDRCKNRFQVTMQNTRRWSVSSWPLCQLPRNLVE